MSEQRMNKLKPTKYLSAINLMFLNVNQNMKIQLKAFRMIIVRNGLNGKKVNVQKNVELETKPLLVNVTSKDKKLKMKIASMSMLANMMK